jgi:hypothetical protein
MPTPHLHWLERAGPFGLTWHEWLACLCAAPSGAFGVAYIGRALAYHEPGGWLGLFLLIFAFALRAWILGHDLD